ncbi:CPBP family intramembrane metalloprotease [bacterium]|nr:CPBP family intramembrane metalloprotease [bacterium]
MNPLSYALMVFSAYIVLQAFIIVVLKFLPKVRLSGQIARTVVINLINYSFFIIAGIIGIGIAPEAAKISTAGFYWIIPVGIVAGFLFFIFCEVATRLSLKYASEFVFDLQEMAVSPVFPKGIFIPGFINLVLVKPFAEEILFRAFLIGVLSTEMHWATAILITIVLENLRYPQLAWFARNTIRALTLGLLFVVSPSIILPLTASLIAHFLIAINQVSRVRRLVSEGEKSTSKSRKEVILEQELKTSDRSQNEDDTSGN